MADQTKRQEQETVDVAYIRKTLEVMDDRLDNLDSVVSAIVERMMKRSVNLSVTCPHCGKNVEITLMGSGKLQK